MHRDAKFCQILDLLGILLIVCIRLHPPKHFLVSLIESFIEGKSNGRNLLAFSPRRKGRKSHKSVKLGQREHFMSV